ncbi:tape measure protein [Phenylobacterium sp.]|jgi:tape measure domain-containing protein|uniref:tape measure protein n=1 Tax=Phenylobacterium sp. TaxID=1871053 RepID=UPI002F41AEAB
MSGGGAALVAKLRIEGDVQDALGGLGKTENAVGDLGHAAEGASHGMELLELGIAGLGLEELAKEATTAATAMNSLEIGLGAVAGGAAGAQQSISSVRQEAVRLGLDIRPAIQSFQDLAGATHGTYLEGAATRDIWDAVTVAGVAMGRSNAQIAEGLNAVTHIASTGTVNMEELRRQMSTAIPGAVNIAAAALGVTNQKFDEMVQKGQVVADDFLPKFAAQLKTNFGPAVDRYLTSDVGKANVALGDLKITIDDLQVEAGKAFLGGIAQGIAGVDQALTKDQVTNEVRVFGQELGQLASLGAQGLTVLASNIGVVELAVGGLVAIKVGDWFNAHVAGAVKAAAAEASLASATKAAALTSAEAAAALAANDAEVATATQASLVVAREEAIAQLAAANAKISAGQAATALAAETGVLEGALAAETTATEALTAAELARSAALTELATLGRQQIGVQEELAAATVAQATAQEGLAAATALAGGAMTTMKGVGTGLLALVGGPWGAAFLAAGGAVAYMVSQVEAAAAADAKADEASRTLAQAMAEAETLGLSAAQVYAAHKAGALGLVDPLRNLTGDVSGLTTQMILLAEQNRNTHLTNLQKEIDDTAKSLAALEKLEAQQSLAVAAMSGEAGGIGGATIQAGEGANPKIKQLQAQLAQANADKAALLARSTASIAAGLGAPPAKEQPKADKGKTDRGANTLVDLQAQLASENALTAAIQSGAAATDQWKAEDFARQALEKSGLTHKKQLTDAEQALADKITATAKAEELVKLDNQRDLSAQNISFQMKQETQALVDQAAAAAQGGTALEDWQVKQAGLQVLQQQGVRSLDQLRDKTLADTEAAMADAEAHERQAIATQKALAVAGVLENLDKQTKAEQARTLAIQGGIQAEANYTIAQAEQQAIDAAAKNLTDEQIAQIKAKVDAQIALKAANDAADATKQEQKELDLLKLGNDQRLIQQRIDKDLLSQGLQKVALANQEVQARARITATMAQAAADDATAIGNLKDSLEKAFVDTGKLSFDDVGKYAEQQLRKAIYNAFLAKPIDMLVNLVVNSMGSTAQLSGIGGSPATGGGLNLAGLTNSAASFAPLLVYEAGNLLGSSLTSLLGGDSSQSKVAGQAGGIIGGIPGAIIGLLSGKASNDAAISTLSGTSSFAISGDKKTDDTSTAVTTASNAVLQGEQALIAAGATLNTTVTSLDLGTRDLTHVFLSSGEEVRSAVGDPAAAAEAGLDAVLRGATFVNAAEQQMVNSMLDAGKGFDDIETAIQGFNAAQTLGQSITDAIQQITDPEGFAIGQLKTQEAARAAQVQAAADAGFLTAQQLSDINAQLTTLDGLELDQTMKQFGNAVSDATDRLNQGQDLEQQVSDAILQITDPNGYKIQQIQEAIDQQRAQAADLLSTGSVSPDIMSQLDTLENLQIGQALEDLAGGVTDASKAFDDARPKIQQWLDQFTVSSAAELSPQAALVQAKSEYEQQLALAQGGDPTALGNITTYADQLETADRSATSSASARLALAQQIEADMLDLTRRTGVDVTSPAQSTTQALTSLVAINTQELQLAQTQAASGGQPVVLTNLPALSDLFSRVLTDQTNALVVSNDQARDAVVAAVDAVANAVVGLQDGLANDMAAVGERLDAVVATGQQQVSATGDLADQTRVLAAVGAAA